MTEPVTAAEIADLLHRIRHLTEDRHASPTERAAVLARKAELLARIGNQPATAGTTTTHTRSPTTPPAIADRARHLSATSTSTPSAGGAKSQENSSGTRQPGGAKSEENSGASSG